MAAEKVSFAKRTRDQLLGTLVLLAVISEDPQQVQAAMNAIDAAGELTYRGAAGTIRNYVALWYDSFPEGFEVREGAFAAGTGMILERVVPESKQSAVLLVYGAVLRRVAELGPDQSIVPGHTDDPEADLYLTAIYGAWYASQPELDPAGKVATLERIAAHLDHGQLHDGAELDEGQAELAYTVLAAAFGDAFAGSVSREPNQRKYWENDLVGAAYTHHAHPDEGSQEYLIQLHGLVVQGRRQDAEDAAARVLARVPRSDWPVISAPSWAGPDAVARAWLGCELIARHHPYIRVEALPRNGFRISWTGEPTVEQMRELVAEVITTRGIPLDPAAADYRRTKLDLDKLADEATRLTAKGGNKIAVRTAILDQFRKARAERGVAGVLGLMTTIRERGLG
ncbi:hypothetical protein [Kutzneria buriramensis]|uniref:Uncharacterized protein n=1 Tax=Kutzneria buriramensis TaxID=1045776 RepID=A0A3E0G838_9PSEU|nr:hypothetical protein [Kutzneria buriramensis]REH18316.1 hypothetical protein BCF44_13671 [Kutzneria buriramensis]